MMAAFRRIPGELVLFICLNIANTSNYLFQVVMGRELGPSSYGLLATVIALVNVATIASIGLQTGSAKAIASRTEPAPPLRHASDDPFTRTVVLGGAVLTVLFAVAAPAIALFLHANVGPALVVAAAIIPAGLLALAQGRFQGLHRLHAYAVLALLVAGLRLLLGPIAVALGTGVTGAGMAVAVAAVLGSLWALHRSLDAGAVSTQLVGRDVIRGALAFVAFWLLVSADIVVARHYLSGPVSGQYGVASVMGKAVLWLPAAIAIALFPKVVRDESTGESSRGSLVRALLVTLGLGIVGVAGLVILGPYVIPLFFGHKYQFASTFAWQIGLACIPFALANLLIYYHLATKGRWLPAALAVAAVVEFGAMAILHQNVHQIAFGLGLGGFVLCVGLLLMAFLRPATGRTANDKVSEEDLLAAAVAEQELTSV